MNLYQSTVVRSVAVVLMLSAKAEVEVVFEGSAWVLPPGSPELNENALSAGICFRADQKALLSETLSELVPSVLVDYPIKFSLLGKNDSVTLEPLREGSDQSSRVILVVWDQKQISAMSVPLELSERFDPTGVDFGSMSPDFEGIENFREVVRQGVRRAKNAKEVPRFVFIGRPGTQFGEMVKILQIVKEEGCVSGLVRLDDKFPDLSIIVQHDAEVKPPIADLLSRGGGGRIVVNIFNDGRVATADRVWLLDDEAVMGYIKSQSDRFEEQGQAPRLFLRGDKDAVLKYCRRVIRLSAKVGVDNVVFATYAAPEK